MSGGDWVAAVALIGGALLMALGGIGLLRFPDVFTRTHASAKAASVGVIGTTAAAAVEAGAAAGLLVLVVVTLLLFLSAPLGLSLLGRAAYHDPQTPRAPTTREPAAGLPRPEPARIGSSGGTSPLLAFVLFGAWVALFGSLRATVVVSGAAVAAVLAVALRRLAPRWPEAFLHPVYALRFAGHFALQLVASTWMVIRALFVPLDQLRPAIVEVPLRVRTRNELTLLVNSISFTPGTLALELDGDRLFVHMLTVDDPGAVIAEIERLEDLIMAAFGPRKRLPNHVTDDV